MNPKHGPGLAALALAWVSLVSCATPGLRPEPPAPPEPLTPLAEVQPFSAEKLYDPSYVPGCKQMLDAFCTYLYSPEASGNLRVGRGPASRMVLQGRTRNDFSAVFYAYSQAKLRKFHLLPRDFQKVLRARGYLGQLETLLHRPPRDRMTLPARADGMRLEWDVNNAWAAAIEEAVLRRMEKANPGYHRLRDDWIPIELRIEARRIRRQLISEISQALWSEDDNWKRVERSFQTLRASFLAVLGRLDIPEELRRDWTDRIRSVRLVLPGSLPEIADAECSTTEVNAFYYSHLNVLTVCAGDFNSEDIYETLAHEMAHALDVDRSLYLYQARSDLGMAIRDLRQAVCAPATFSCDRWRGFQAEYDGRLERLRGFRPAVPEFQRCLQRRPPTRAAEEGDLERLAARIINDEISELAGSDAFLRLTQAKVPLPDGKLLPNPHYLNPCDYSIWSQGEEPIDDTLTLLLFFTAEYRCTEGSAPDRLRAAIGRTKDMGASLTEEVLRMEGEFSGRETTELEGLSSSPSERFADVMGSYALAETLRQLPEPWDRRNTFLAGSAWQCTRPSLASRFPAESAVQKEFVFDSHTEGDSRMKEFFTAPVREAIGCRRDFEFNECRLPFK